MLGSTLPALDSFPATRNSVPDFMPSNRAADRAPDPASAGLSEGLKTAVTFLLFLHLFALLVGVSSNDSASQLELGLRKTPLVVPYLQTLMMDLSYSFNLTFGPSDTDVSDAETWIEAELNTSKGSETVTLPPADMKSRQRLRHFESLARAAAAAVGTPNRESLVPAAVAQNLVSRYGASGGTIRIKRKTLPNEPFAPFTPAERTLYEAQILLLGGGRVDLLKVEAAGESAPAATKP